MRESIVLKDVFAISDRPAGLSKGRERWTKIGIGFVNRDNSINVVLDAIPLNGRFQIRDRQDKIKTKGENYEDTKPFADNRPGSHDDRHGAYRQDFSQGSRHPGRSGQR